LRYSARDLAVWRARQLQVPVVLGSATPSLESWHHALKGRYRKLELRERAVQQAVLPSVKLIDTSRRRGQEGLTEQLVQAIRLRMERGEQSLLFLNRRGYSPVITCESCGWVSECKRCTASMVLHKSDYRLRCHHCSLEMRIRWDAAPSASRKACKSCSRKRACCASTPTARAARAVRRKPSTACTGRRWTSWSARKWSPRGTTSRT
jgi:primosomal protein N'